MFNNSDVANAFVIFVCYLLLNIFCDFFMVIQNKIYVHKLFHPTFILNYIDYDKKEICSLLKIHPFFLKLYLKGYFLLNREQILILAHFLQIDPNSIYKFNIFDSIDLL